MRRWTLPGIAALATLALLACSSSGGGGTSTKSGLAAALAQVRDTPANRNLVQFDRTKAAVAANGGIGPSGPYLRAIGLGASRLFASYRPLATATGIDLTTADYALTAGNPPAAGLLLAGLDLGKTGARLESLGAKRTDDGPGRTYRFRPDNGIATDDQLARAVPGVLNALNVVQLDGTTLRTGAGAAALTQTRPSGPSLLDDGGFRDVASCLDDPLAAQVTDRVPPAWSGAGVQVLGVGLSGAKGTTPTEQLCVRADGAAAAKALAAKIRAAVRTGDSARTRQPWSQLLAGADVTVDGDVVRLRAHPVGGRPGGILLEALTTGDLPGQ